MELLEDKQKKTFAMLKGDLGLKSVMQTPKIEKVVVSVGVGKMLKSGQKDKTELVAKRLMAITGQKPASRGAKKSIATYKTREGDLVGYQVTLRGARMNDFLNRLLNVSLPRTKDFKGISKSGIDEMGNYSLGIKEHTIFPETADEDIKDVFGMAVTVVTTAKDKKTAETYLRHLGFPFQK
jgi:large subunit ribosomal protein L5